jgi:transcriptional regulator with XRE-family HTH domain
MARKYRELQERMSPTARARAIAGAEQLEATMHLQELRKARALSQETLAELLHITQPEVSRVERSTDLYLSTLRRFLAAMGADLRVVAVFPDGEVELPQFAEPEASAPERRVAS